MQSLSDYSAEDASNRINQLKEQIRIKNERIAVLEAELKRQQDKEKENIQKEINKFYPWMCEAIRARRASEMIGDDLDRYRKKADKAERGLRNVKKWLEINGWGSGSDA